MAPRILFLTLISFSSVCIRGGQLAAASGKKSTSSLREAISLFQQERYAEARKELLEVTHSDPTSAEAFFYLGMAELHLGSAAAAERFLRHALELNQRSVNTLYNLGVLLLDEKKPRQAIPYLEEASQLGPPSPELWVNLIRAYLETGNKERAFQRAQLASRQFGNQPAFDLEVGKCYLAHDLPAEGRAFLEKADHLAPAQPEIVMLLADTCLRGRDVGVARKALESVSTKAQNLAEYHHLMGQCHFLSGERQEALSEINLAVRMEPQNAVYLLTLARYEQKYGDQQAAITVLEEAGRLAPDVAEIPYSIAVSYFIADRFEDATKFLDRALQIEPAFDRALFLRGLGKFAMGKFAEAEVALAQAIQSSPKNPYYPCFYGMVLVAENRLEDALPQLEKALTLDPSYALAHYQLGKLLARRGRHEQASVELERAVQLDPALTESYYQLAHTYMRLGNQSKADAAMAAFQKLHKEEYSERKEVLRQMQQTVRGND